MTHVLTLKPMSFWHSNLCRIIQLNKKLSETSIGYFERIDKNTSTCTTKQRWHTQGCTNCNWVGLRWKVVGHMTGSLGSSMVEYWHSQRKTLGSSSGQATMFYLLQNQIGQLTYEQKSVRGLLPFFGQTSVINRQYTRCTLSVSVYTAKHNL